MNPTDVILYQNDHNFILCSNYIIIVYVILMLSFKTDKLFYKKIMYKLYIKQKINKKNKH